MRQPKTKKKTSASPLQKDLAHKILEYMRDQAWTRGKKISVPPLARQFNVSRSPIVGALNLLVDEKILGPTKTRGLEIVCDISDIDSKSLMPNSHLEELFHEMMRDRAKGILSKEVTEAELMPRYNVSRGVIRKLLMRFATDGLAHRLQGHGWQFVDVLEDSDAVKESFEFRTVIECAALRAPSFKPDLTQLAQVKAAHEKVLNGPRNSISGSDWFNINARFHEILAQFSGNRFLADAIRQQNNLRRMKESADYVELPIQRIRQSCEEHIEIINAVEVGDNDWAEALMRHHLKKTLAY